MVRRFAAALMVRYRGARGDLADSGWVLIIVEGQEQRAGERDDKSKSRGDDEALPRRVAEHEQPDGRRSERFDAEQGGRGDGDGRALERGCEECHAGDSEDRERVSGRLSLI